MREGELIATAVVAKNATTAADGKTYQVEIFNLDAIISVGYRVNSKRGTQFRIWASSVLKEYLIKGFALNQRRLAEKGVAELRGVLDLLAGTLEQHRLVNDTGLAVLDLVRRYGLTWSLLLQYDEDRLSLPAVKHQDAGVAFDLAVVRQAIESLRSDLAAKGESTNLFGRERGESLAALLGAIHQTFGGQSSIRASRKWRPISSISSSRIGSSLQRRQQADRLAAFPSLSADHWPARRDPV